MILEQRFDKDPVRYRAPLVPVGSSPEVSGRLVGSPVFNTGVGLHCGPRGSIPCISASVRVLLRSSPPRPRPCSVHRGGSCLVISLAVVLWVCPGVASASGEGSIPSISASVRVLLRSSPPRPRPCSADSPHESQGGLPPYRRRTPHGQSPRSGVSHNAPLRRRWRSSASPRPPAEGTEHEHPLGSESDVDPVRACFEGTDERRLTNASSGRSAESLSTSHEDSVPRDVSGRLSLPIGTDGRYDVWMRSDSWWDIDWAVRRRRAGWGGSM